MSNHTLIEYRRKFLKAATYATALSAGGLSTFVFANEKTQSKPHQELITLFNQSDKTVALDASKPVSLDVVNGWVVVNINKATKTARTEEPITLDAGQRLSFMVDSEFAPLLKESGDYIVITNDYSALNNMVPVSTYDSMVA